MAPTSTLPDNPVYAFVPAYGPADQPQPIRLVFKGLPGYVPTALVALSLVDAERLCSKLNAKLGLDKNTWMKMAAQAMQTQAPSTSTSLH